MGLMKTELGNDVFTESIQRMIDLYAAGHRVVVAFSAGKDSGICLEICIIAAMETGRLPVEVAMRDEEIMYPGTFEYAERTAQRPEVEFHWIWAGQPIVNYYNRENPYFWVFDETLDPEQWVRQPPDYAYKIAQKDIGGVVNKKRFPPAEGKKLCTVIGLRTQESLKRIMAITSSGGYMTGGETSFGAYNCRPIYDWTDGDVWKAVKDNGWDYNEAYDVMNRMGIPRNRLRIAPPTLALAGMESLKLSRKAWPKWFEKVCQRLPGVRQAAMFGLQAITPARKYGETWKECFYRACVDEAPTWMRERNLTIVKRQLSEHAHHSTEEYPQAKACPNCRFLTSWQKMATDLFTGDPFSMKQSFLPPVEPEFFREGAGYWGGKPTW